MDEELLAEARRAQERLIDAERDAEVARAEFNRTVRRLQLHGSSLRELAAALGLSHQRVHQIVEAAGGSRRWTNRRSGPRPACTFCGRSQDQARKLIAGPGVYICDVCIALAHTVLGSGEAASTELGPMTTVPEHERQEQCSFCGKRREKVAGLAAVRLGGIAGKLTGSMVICTECLALCDEILDEDLAPG
jgi:hypothetical protein